MQHQRYADDRDVRTIAGNVRFAKLNLIRFFRNSLFDAKQFTVFEKQDWVMTAEGVMEESLRVVWCGRNNYAKTGDVGVDGMIAAGMVSRG